MSKPTRRRRHHGEPSNVYGATENHARLHKKPGTCARCFIWQETQRLKAKGISA